MKKNEGSILIIVIVFTTIMLGIGITIFSIIEKEILAQSFSERSKEAFLIADSAWECALYNDFRRLAFDLSGQRSASVKGVTCGDRLEVFKTKDSGDLDEDYVIDSGINTRSELFGVNPKVAEFKFTVQSSVQKRRNPCADVILTKSCVRSATNTSTCSDSINQIENELTVIGYGSCGENAVGGKDKRGEVRRRFKIKY